MCKFSLSTFLLVLFLLVVGAKPQTVGVPVESERWSLEEAGKAEFLGRPCLKGKAILPDVDFENGIIEVDMAVTGARSYPGIIFRASDKENYERIYIRPHLPRVFENVVQYEGTFNGLDSWQLYYGPGKTAAADIPANKWFHVKVEVNNKQAKFYIDDMTNAVLYITDLAHGCSRGSLGIWGPMDESAFFANFSYEKRNDLKIPEPPEMINPIGMITDWQLTQPFKFSKIDFEQLPEKQGLRDLKWRAVHSLPSGLVDVSRYFGRLGPAPDIIWAKTIIKSDIQQTKQYAFGYSDAIAIFLNGKLLFSGNSSYTSRDANFQGIVGLNDYIFLPLKKGANELIVGLTEAFGGWGCIFQDVEAQYVNSSVKQAWEIKNKLGYPECAVIDSKRSLIYVSNFVDGSGSYVSKISLEGKIDKQRWIENLYQPTGMCLYKDKLYVVGRYNLVEIDLTADSITARYPFPSPVFANDVTADNNGCMYITDGGKGAVYKFENGKIGPWLNGPGFLQANGITYDEGKLIIGTGIDGSLKSIDIATKEITNVAAFGQGVAIDGLVTVNHGTYLLSDYSGRIFKVTRDGKKELLLDRKARPVYMADFAYNKESGLLVVPGFEDNRLTAYKLK